MARKKRMTKTESTEYLKEMAAPVTNANSSELIHEPNVNVVIVEPELPEEYHGEMATEEGGLGPVEEAAIAEVEADNKQNNSVVAAKFKDKYLANARANGIPGKAAKRSNWDWLSQQIASVCLDEKHKIRIGDFTALLDANGIDHSRWTNRNKGWEGRFRMTGRVALQKVVAEAGELKYANGDYVAAPTEFINRFKAKV